MKASSLPSRCEALNILKEAGCSTEIIEHAKKVADFALKIAEGLRRQGLNINPHLIEVGAILHDIGRSRTHGADHGYCGGTIACALGLPKEVVNIIERHVGAGISAEEASALGLPNRDFIPETLEEKIVAYADKRIKGDRIVNCDEALEDFARSLGYDHPAVSRLKALFTEFSLVDVDL
ncbi:MAG: HDIG domain-containing protein [Candidatus Bathyarchaeia archaeon]